MAIILCIETSSTNCSVALATTVLGTFKNNLGINHCLDLIEDHSDSYSHGERLHVYIQDILSKNDLQPSDLAAIAVSAGPGSYTGLRIGVASAKGMCYALDIPLIAISTLAGIAKLDTSGAEITISFLDARRMEVYAAVYKEAILVADATPVVLDERSFENYRAQNSVTIIGTGTTKFQEIIGANENIQFVERQPSALSLCDLAISAHKKSDTVDVAYFEPIYLKEFAAN